MRTRRLDLVGQRFGLLLVLEFADINHGTRWLCQCDCGSRTVVSGSKIKSGSTKSCGCLIRAPLNPRKPKHGHTKLGSSPSPTYRSWYAMVGRCANPRDTHYADYGGRGIKVCDRWRLSFVDFLADMGTRPEGTTIDRIDVNGNYEPSNCRWATRSEQRRNCRRETIGYEKALEISLDLAAGASGNDVLLGIKHGVKSHVVRGIRIGESWKDAYRAAREIATHSDRGGE